MRICGFLFALCVMPLALPAIADAAGNACPTTPAKIAAPPNITLPADSKITAKEIAFEIDLGSDGHVRALQLDQSSGDGAVDLLVQQTLQDATYVPPQTGCVAHSGGLRLAFGLPAPPDTPQAPTSPTPAPKPTALKLNTNCTPYVIVFITPVARDRKRTGSATLAIELDAAGTAIAPPTLKKSTGSPVLDQEAIRIARTGQYNFVPGSTCAPQPVTYSLDLTFL
jgi:TonB family protein